MGCDVFLCTCADDDIRNGLFRACYARWKLSYKFQIVSGFYDDFQLNHRSEAERAATTPVYCVADDDCMPLGNKFLEDGLAMMHRYQDFGILALSERGGETVPLGGSWFEDDNVFETQSAGGIYLIRKGILRCPSSHPWFDDVQVGEQMKAAGFKVGYLKKVQFNHLGFRLSTCFPERTGITQVAEID